MSLVAVKNVWMPPLPTVNLTALSTTTIDATGEKIAFIGQVWNGDRASKNIARVQFAFGPTITKAGGSGLTVSLQDVLNTAGTGNPFRPDETQDQTVAIANADIPAANAWYRTNTFSASRAVAFGETLAVVIEFDGSGRLGADVITLASRSSLSASAHDDASDTVLLTASWAAQSRPANVILEFDDGTFGTLSGASVVSAAFLTAFNSGTASGSGGDERGLKFRVPFPCKIDGVWLAVNIAGLTSDFEVVFGDGSSDLETIAVPAERLAAVSSARPLVVSIPERQLAAATDYYLSIRPTSANNVTLYGSDLDHADHRQAIMGTDWCWTHRTDAGAWTDITTRMPFAGVRISALDSGGSGGLVTPLFGGGVM